MALSPDALLVGSAQAGVVERLSRTDGSLLTSAAPDAQTEIIGGATALFARYAMGGKAPRAMAYSPSLETLFYASLGPNIGPITAEDGEVSPNSGVAILSGDGRRVTRHWGSVLAVPRR